MIYSCYTNLVHRDDLVDDASIAASPMIVQARIPKAKELRITIVGDTIFPVAFETAGVPDADVDWRRLGLDITNIAHTVHPLPNSLEASLRHYMRRLNLVFGCVDMILTPGGEYVFLEINPSGQWGWIEACTGRRASSSGSAICSGRSWHSAPSARS